jgi:Tol biopolymer transport system component
MRRSATWVTIQRGRSLKLSWITTLAISLTSVLFAIACGDGPSGSKEALFGPHTIAFVSTRDGNTEIYAMNPDGSNQTRLTNNSARDGRPVWSPDGTKIAFRSDRDGNEELYIMGFDGSNQTNVTNLPGLEMFDSWSPDSTKIAFTLTHANSDGLLVRGGDDLYVVNADGSNRTKLMSSSSMGGWSPDSSKIAFTFYRDGNNDLYIATVGGSEPKKISSGPGSMWFGSWSPDSTKISFRSRQGENYGAYIINADGSGQTRLSNDREGVSSWSSDGTRIAFSDKTDRVYEIYVMNIDGSGTTRLTDNTAWDVDPLWSPDGTKIAFSSDRNGSPDIYVMDPDGSNQTRLTDGQSAEGAYSWSLDGTEIFFGVDDGSYGLYVMDADGSNQTRWEMVDNLNLKKPHWFGTSDQFSPSVMWTTSPDGTKITFSSTWDFSTWEFIGDRHISVSDFSGSGQTRLTDNVRWWHDIPGWPGSPGKDWDPSWSPDRTKKVTLPTLVPQPIRAPAPAPTAAPPVLTPSTPTQTLPPILESFYGFVSVSKQVGPHIHELEWGLINRSQEQVTVLSAETQTASGELVAQVPQSYIDQYWSGGNVAPGGQVSSVASFAGRPTVDEVMTYRWVWSIRTLTQGTILCTFTAPSGQICVPISS